LRPLYSVSAFDQGTLQGAERGRKNQSKRRAINGLTTKTIRLTVIGVNAYSRSVTMGYTKTIITIVIRIL